MYILCLNGHDTGRNNIRVKSDAGELVIDIGKVTRCSVWSAAVIRAIYTKLGASVRVYPICHNRESVWMLSAATYQDGVDARIRALSRCLA